MSSSKPSRPFTLSRNSCFPSSLMRVYRKSSLFRAALTTLDISYNELGRQGAKAIAEMLKFNTVLTKSCKLPYLEQYRKRTFAHIAHIAHTHFTRAAQNPHGPSHCPATLAPPHA